MINVPRPQQGPSSLDNAEVNAYVVAYCAYEEAKALGHQVETPKKPSVDYRSPDVIDYIGTVFHSKCWLTEQKYHSPASLQIDHFLPQSEFPQYRLDWKNLLPIDHKAHDIKPKLFPLGGYLHPCEPDDDVEQRICHELFANAAVIRFSASDPSDQKANNTASLLNLLHERKTAPSGYRATEELRELIKRRHEELRKAAEKYFNGNLSVEDQLEVEKELRGYFSRKASFTMLMRSSEIGQRLRHLHED